MKKILFVFIVLTLTISGIFISSYTIRARKEVKVLKRVVSRLTVDTRIAEVLVTKVQFDEEKKKNLTTIKLLEFDTKNRPLKPKYYTFSGNIIQFQSLVIRFDDMHIKRGDLLRGKSAYLLWKVFMLDGANTKEYEITKVNTVPAGYKIEGITDPFEEKLWHEFWKYATNTIAAKSKGIKNAQIEAPGVMFMPGTLYVLKIEHDGGIRIDAQTLPEILKGEHIPK